MSTADPGATRSSNWNLPNLITIIRIVLVPIFVWLLLADAGADGALRWVAAVLFIVAIATDGVDGHIARSRGLVTDLGILLDPIADKLLTGAALVTLSILAELPWWVTIVVLVREVGITVWRFVELGRGNVVPASRGGKTKTIIQSIAISAALLPLWRLLPAWNGAEGFFDIVNVVLMTAMVLITVYTGVEYLWQAGRMRRTGRAA